MGKTYERMDGRLRSFIEEQPLFFTATAPLSGEGTVNLSPKGLKGSFVVLDELTVAYLDFAGSNAETVAHLRENGRITLMWCAFQSPPNIVRVHGRGEPVFRDDPRFGELPARLPDIDPSTHGLCAIVVVTAEPVRDSCGFAVPLMTYDGDRELHARRFAREDTSLTTRPSDSRLFPALRARGHLFAQLLLRGQGPHRHEPRRAPASAPAAGSDDVRRPCDVNRRPCTSPARGVTSGSERTIRAAGAGRPH